jgi:hypothetical protein
VLLPSDGATGDRFGAPVAIDGDWVIVGAWGHSGAGPGSGAAYVFNRSGSTWSQHAQLLAFDAHAMNTFGSEVAISGSLAAVACSDDDSPGFVYPFQRVGPVWLGGGKFAASDSSEGNQFGVSLALRGTRPGARGALRGDAAIAPAAGPGEPPPARYGVERSLSGRGGPRR